jgi:hypothetical protein
VLRGHKGPVHQLLRVGETVWSVSSDKTCVVWGFKNGVPQCLETLQGKTNFKMFSAKELLLFPHQTNC